MEKVYKVVVSRKLKQWRTALKQSHTIKCFEVSMDILRCRMALKRFGKYQTYVDKVTEAVTFNRTPFLILQVFRAWKKQILKKKMANYHGKIQVLKSEVAVKHRAFSHFLRLHDLRHFQYKLGHFCIIQIRKTILLNYFKDLKAYARYKKIKRKCPYIHDAKLVQKAFHKMSQFCLKS